jgi:transposase
MDKKTPTTILHFTDEEKHQIIQEFLSGGTTKQAIWKKYTGRDHEHGKILDWIRQFGYNSSFSQGRSRGKPIIGFMPKKKPISPVDTSQPDSFETIQLKKRIADLEKQLKEAELKAIAFSTMIDIAEREYKIPIKKKFNTKP